MMKSTARFLTARASTYLQQLCKHFGHKVPVEFTAHEGHITLPFGTCDLRADEAGLTLINICEPENIEKMEKVIGDHLARFAFREEFSLTWQRGG